MYRPKFLIALLIGITLAAQAHAAGVVRQCNETNLLTALAAGGNVTFSCSGTIVLTLPITVSAEVSLDGAGQNVTLSGAGAVQIFSISFGASLKLNDLTVAAGNTALFGGAVNNLGTLTISNSTFSGNTAGFLGGAIFNLGHLQVTNSTFTRNSALIGGGGAILNDGTAQIADSTFSGNSANSGGAIDNSSGTLELMNSTLYGNTASDIGGALLNDDTTTVVNCTIANNTAFFGGGADDNSGTLRLENSIVSKNAGGNCSGDVSGAGNLSSDSSCPGRRNSNAELGPLQYNGGPTYTLALLPGSPAIDTALKSDCPATDQRGVPRPQGAGCDIGAYERASVPSSGHTCITYYNDTFPGNVNVSPGQTCGFVSGGVTGNMTMNGGNLVLSNTSVMGNLQISGGSFFIAPNTKIGNDLQIQNIPQSAAQNRICGSNVHGNLQLQNSGVAVTIGLTGSVSCPGNKIGGNLQVHNNTAETVIIDNNVNGNLEDHNNTALTKVIGNIVGNNLQCQNNSDIIGGPNTAKQKQGQCY